MSVPKKLRIATVGLGDIARKAYLLTDVTLLWFVS